MLKEMLELLPDPAKFMKTIPASEYNQEYQLLDDEAIKPLIAAALPELGHLCEHCPVCMLAAFRQKKIPVPIVDGFNYKEEMKETWKEIHSRLDDYY